MPLSEFVANHIDAAFSIAAGLIALIFGYLPVTPKRGCRLRKSSERNASGPLSAGAARSSWLSASFG